MAVLTKTAADFVTAIETGTIREVQVAIKKPGADRVIMVVRIADASQAQGQSGLEVWDVG